MIAALATIASAALLAALLVPLTAMALANWGLFPPFRVQAFGKAIEFAPTQSLRSQPSKDEFSSVHNLGVRRANSYASYAAVVIVTVHMQSIPVPFQTGPHVVSRGAIERFSI